MSESELADRLGGRMLEPGDPGYDEQQRIWDSVIDRRPSLFALCLNAVDDLASVIFCARSASGHHGSKPQHLNCRRRDL